MSAGQLGSCTLRYAIVVPSIASNLFVVAILSARSDNSLARSGISNNDITLVN